MTAASPARIVVRTLGAGRYQVVDEATGPVSDVNDFLRALEIRGLSRHTLRAYAFDLASLHRWLARTGRALRSLTAAALVDFIAWQRAAGAQPNSINRRLTTVRLLYRFCTDRDLEAGPGTVPPAPYFRGRGRDRALGLHLVRRVGRRKLRVKTPRRLVEPLTADQVRRFLGRLRRYRDLAIVQLLLFCGLRSDEVLRLELDDLLFDEQRVRVRGKGDRERVVPLSDSLAVLLRDYVRFERPTCCRTGHVFVVLQGWRRGQPMSAAGLRGLFRRRRRQPELAHANPHRFRHTFGADMARAGVRLPMLQKMMGHVAPSTTLQYINLSLEDLAAEYRRAVAEIKKRYESS